MGAPETTQFLPVTATAQIDDAKRQQIAASQALVVDAESLVVDSAPMAEYAHTFLRDVKGRSKMLEAMYDDIAAPFKEGLNRLRGWIKPAIDANNKAEEIVKGKLADFTKKEQERVAAAERARKDAERRAREEAEQQAAAARARAEEAARKAREEAARAEAERARQEEAARVAREAGDKKAAAAAERAAQAAAAEKAKKEEEERQKLAGAEAEATRIQLEAAVRADANNVPVQAAAEIKGFGMRKNWVAELVDGMTPEDAGAAIVRAICGLPANAPLPRADLLALLPLDMKVAGKLAKAQEKSFSVPGLVAINRPVATSRG